MAKYCKTYKILCVCPSCEGNECRQSPRTRGEAEIARSCQLDEAGNVIEDKPTTHRPPSTAKKSATEFSGTRQVKLPPVLPPGRREFPRPLLFGLAAATVVLVIGAWYFLRDAEEEPSPFYAVDLTEFQDEEIIEEPEPEPTEVASVPADPPPPVFQLPPVLERPPRQAVPRGEIFVAPPRFTELKISGNQLARQGRFQEARDVYLQAIAEAPTHHEGYTNLANTFSDEGNHAAAEPIYIESLRINPSSTTTRFNLANTYLRAGRWADAEREFTAVLIEQPTDWEAALLLGIAFYRMERWDFAAAAFQAVLANNPHSAHAHYNLHLTYGRLGATHLARTYLNEAFRLDPSLRGRS